jgi:FAD/FMN-containing dehydrogenase
MFSLPLLKTSDELTLQREQNQKTRFERQHRDDSRTAIPPAAVRDLESELRRCIEGEVRFDDGSRALYATDGSNYRQAPIGVVIPRSKEDVVQTMALARKYGAPILSRGGGTSLRGQCCNVAVVMDFTKYLHHVLHIDPDCRLGTVEPGCVLDTLRNQAKKKYQLTFGPDPATHNHNAIGGMLGNDSCGTHSLLAAKHGMGYRTADNTHELEILTYDGLRMRVGETSPEQMERYIREGGRRGEIYAKIKALVAKYGDEIRRRYPKLPRRVSGYNLEYLLPEHGCHLARALVGSEATCVTILEATLCLVPEPKVRITLVLGYPDVYTAGDHVTDILPLNPIALEGLDQVLIEYMGLKGKRGKNLSLLPEGKGFLLVEFGGDSKEEAGIPVVVLEPSCASVFRDEMTELLAGNYEAERLHNQVFYFSEFLDAKLPEYQSWQPPRFERKALVHGHCHHRAILGFQNEVSILNRMGIESSIPDPGCCGMAGSFGFEAPHYEISMKVGEQRLLPAVRQADSDTIIIADGFSCHEQILQGAGRKPLHLAQVLQMALREAPYLFSGDHGPSAYEPRIPSRVPRMMQGNGHSRRRRRRVGVGTATLLGAGAIAGGLLAWQMYQEKAR